MENVDIREANPGEEAEIRSVIDDAYSQWRGTVADMPDVASGIADEISANRMYVATSGGEILGILNAGAHDKSFHVMNIAVSSDAAGRGIGRALMAHAEELAIKSGLRRMELATHDQMAANVSIYERLGWTVTGRDGSKVMMHRNLTDDRK